MKFEKVVKDDIIILRILEPRVDSNMAPEFKKELLGHIVQDSPNMIIDLHAVEYMDSSGLGALLFGRRQADRFLGKLVVISPSARVQKLIDIAHLTQALTILDSEEEAFLSFKKQSS